MKLVHSGFPPHVLADKLRRARAGLTALCATLADDQWLGPYLPTINPPLWELGHLVWFQEHWCLRLKSATDPSASPLLEPLLPARRPWADWLYNSSHIPHAARWQAPLPSPRETAAYGEQVLADVIDKLGRGAFEDDFPYYVELALYHELMHTEAWWMNWQALARRPPAIPALPRFESHATLEFDLGSVALGSAPDAGFVFDNEKWMHHVPLEAFAISAHPVTCGEFSAFIDAGGYARAELWSAAGRAWRAQSGASHPLHWRSSASGWEHRRFDRSIALDPAEPVMHVNRFEAEAYCAWCEAMLPSAAQWLRAAAAPGFALGRCWEWTSDMFAPYPGFSPDPYSDYSLPWFHNHAEVRGAGSWATDSALARPTYRNFFTPERSDPFIGFRVVRS